MTAILSRQISPQVISRCLVPRDSAAVEESPLNSPTVHGFD